MLYWLEETRLVCSSNNSPSRTLASSYTTKLTLGLVATGRNANSRLSHLREQGAAILDLDVTASQEILDAKLQEAIAIYGHIDVLVNNAGYVSCAIIEDLH